ncbi:Lrp/AsnC family transcriptional regulator [Anaerotignum faecicola]|nr:Lrp/AsnC family transcriptional regulator [Anaerotignum faecicola]
MRGKILQLIAKNSKLTPEEIAKEINADPQQVAKEIKLMEENRVICGYNTLINYDNTDRELVTALIEVKVTPQRGDGYDKIAERIYRFDEVKAVYLMSGGFDLTVILEKSSLKEIALFVSDKLATIDSVTSTATHFVLKKYKDHGIVIERGDKKDRRMIISP